MVHEERRKGEKRLLRVLSLFLHGYGWLAREAAAPLLTPELCLYTAATILQIFRDSVTTGECCFAAIPSAGRQGKFRSRG